MNTNEIEWIKSETDSFSFFSAKEDKELIFTPICIFKKNQPELVFYPELLHKVDKLSQYDGIACISQSDKIYIIPDYTAVKKALLDWHEKGYFDAPKRRECKITFTGEKKLPKGSFYSFNTYIR